MAGVKWDMVLAGDQRANPIVRTQTVALPDAIGRFPEMLATMFPSTNHSLKTWGRTPGKVVPLDPFWIGVRQGGPLHTDKAYPRYSRQLVVNVDDGFVVRGLSKQETPLTRGTYFVLDTHSPHQLWAASQTPEWYLALSIDSREDDEADAAMIRRLLTYGAGFVFTDADAALAGRAGGQRLG